jgi:Ca-activated chloride channel family protein
MNSGHFYHVEMLLLLWLLPFVFGVFWYGAWQRRRASERFIDAGLLPRLAGTLALPRRRIKAALVLLAMACLVLALARPAWNPKPRTVHRQGRDVVFVLDVSKSMLAEDLAPNRIERAKLAILDCVERLQGDRVGLLVFAGSNVLKCPLTLDYTFFRTMVEDVSVNSVTRGGTLIGDAVRKAMNEVFDDQEKQYKDLILITDGEDQDSYPVQAAEEAGKRGLRLIAIGLGDETQGTRIPITDATGRKTFMTYKGQEVWSKLDAKTLREMAAKTPGGAYLNVATGTFDLGQIYHDIVASAEKRQLEAQTVTLYEEKFQIFLAGAFVLLCAEAWTRERRRNKA